MRDRANPDYEQIVDKLDMLVDSVRSTQDRASVSKVLGAAAGLVEHAAYVLARSDASDAPPTTHLLLLAASIEAVAKKTAPAV